MNDEPSAQISRAADPRLILQSVNKALRVQEAIGQSTGPLSLSQIAEAAGIDRSAAQRITHTLEAAGYLRRGHGGNGYLPGLKLLDRGFEYLRSDILVERAVPILTELRRNARERVDLSLYDGASHIYAVRLHSKRETFYATLVGHRLSSPQSSGGRAMLSRLPRDEMLAIVEIADYFEFTPRTMLDKEEVTRRIDRAREDGYALVLEEVLMGEVAIGAAVTDSAGRPIAAVHLAASLSDWTEEDFRNRMSPLVMEAASTLSQAARDR